MSLYDRISHPALKRAYAYVLGQRIDRELPARSRLDPAAMLTWLHHTELLDVVDGGAKFRYRIVGDEIEHIFRSRMHGRMLDDVFSGRVLALKQRVFRRVVNNHVAILSNHALEKAGRNLCTYERILIPLSENGIDVDVIFGAVYQIRMGHSDFKIHDPEMNIIVEESVESTLGRPTH